jgi:hypothetical protein
MDSQIPTVPVTKPISTQNDFDPFYFDYLEALQVLKSIAPKEALTATYLAFEHEILCRIFQD